MDSSPNSSARSEESVTRSASSSARGGPPFFSSLRWRVTLWYGGALALLMLIFALAVYAGARRVLIVSVAQRAAAVRQQIVAYAHASASEPFGPVTPITLLSDQAALDGFSGPGLYIEAYNPRGFPIGKSSNLGSSDIPTAGYRAWRPPTGLTGKWGIGEIGGSAALSNWISLRSGGRVVAFVYVAESLDNTQRILRAFGIFLLVGFLLAVSVIAAASMWLAGTAIGPIDQIARAAREIGGDDLNLRLNWQGRKDELGSLAATFDDMLARLEAVFARERRFIADASHELKTPLTVINANAHMLERWADHDERARREALATIRSESEEMARVINAMLALAKTESPDALPFERVDFAATVRDAAAAYAPAARAKGLELTAECADVAVRGEPGLLRQLVANLLDNAIKFTDSGSVAVTVAARHARAVLAVRDTGPGMPQQALAHIFDRFYRADPARSRAVDGTGLGLALAKSIARLHGGTISVESESGHGATFSVDLPAEP